MNNEQLAVLKAIDETIALYQQGITDCRPLQDSRIIEPGQPAPSPLMDKICLSGLYLGICLAMAIKTGVKFIDICRIYDYRPKWDSIPIPAKIKAYDVDDLYGYWLSPPSYYYTDEKNLLILETRLAILKDVKSHITKFINEHQSSK